MPTANRIERIERICQTEADRNIGALVPFGAGGLAGAARSIADAQAPSVVIVTGAYIPWATPPAAETDGPPGAALLAAGLGDLDIPTRLLTDRRCLPVVVASQEETAPHVPVDVCDESDAGMQRLRDGYEQAGVTHVIAVERMGPARDGAVRNFRGEDISAFTPPLGQLFEGERAWTTVGVGDGGNELGMGNVPADVVETAIEHGDLIHCLVGCDHLIVSGVSNWGALGLLLATGILRAGPSEAVRERVSPVSHRRAVEACVRAGAVDGTIGRSLPSVDGLSLDEHDAILARMLDAAG